MRAEDQGADHDVEHYKVERQELDVERKERRSAIPGASDQA